MIYSYPCLFVKQKDGYAVFFPDLPLGIGYGEDFEDALSVAFDSLASMLTDEDCFPKELLKTPSEIDSIPVLKILADVFHDSSLDYVIETIQIDDKDLSEYQNS